MTTPMNNKPGALAKALAQFRKIVGDDWVLTGEQDMATYRDPYSVVWDEAEEIRAVAAVAPENVEQVQAIVRAANELGVYLYTISTGKNLGYGGTAPNSAGNVVLDLKRMKRIIEVDDKRNFCIVEPGVSYMDLYRHLQEKGLKLIIDLPSNGMGGVMGNALDHGVGYSHGFYRDHWGSHCGMEVVLPDGELLRTGMAAVPGATTWGDYRYGYGPFVDGIFSQANFGVVTKMGFYLLPMPEHFLTATVSVPRYEDIIPLVDIVNYLEDSNLISFARYGSPMEIPRVISKEPDPELLKLIAQPGGGQPESYEAYARKKGIPFWAVTLSFYGPKATVAANLDYARQRLSAIPGARFGDGESVAFPVSPEALAKSRSASQLGVPNMASFSLGSRNKFNANPSDGHVWFSPVIPRTGQGVIDAHRVFGAAFKEVGYPSRIGPYNGPRSWMPRTFVFMMDFYTSRSDKAENKRVKEAFEHLVRVGAQHGYTEYRTAPLFQDLVASTYSFNDNALLRFHERLKDAIDPNGILAPGRAGVWPRHLRKEKT